MSSRIFVNKNKKPLQTYPDRDANIRDFHKSLPNYNETPLVSIPQIAKELGVGHLLLKDEGSRFGLSAFKILGASWTTKRALEKQLGLKDSNLLDKLAHAAQQANITLYAATDGNHGRAVARMAKWLGIQARIFAPSFVDCDARERIAGEGAILEIVEGDYDETVVVTKRAAESHVAGKGLLISDTALSADDDTPKWMVEGYQTIFDEIEEQIIEVTGQNHITHLVVPVGTGGLAQAAVTHFGRYQRQEKTSIVTVEPQSAACLKKSLEAGEAIGVHAGYTICSGLCCGTISLTTWPWLRDGVNVAVTTEDLEVHKAVSDIVSCGVSAGPCGAAGLAGLRQLIESSNLVLGPEDVVVMICTEGRREYRMPDMHRARI